MRRSKNVNQSSVSEEAAFELGVLYTTVKNDIVAFTAKTSNSYTFADVATRLARLLESEALWQQFGAAQLVSEVRQNGAGYRRGRPARRGDYELESASALFDGPSGRRTLKRRMSPEARQRISEAQTARWAEFHDQERKAAAGWTPARRKKYAKMMKKRWANPKTRPKIAQKGRKFSAETRAKISAKRKAYWDRIRAEQG